MTAEQRERRRRAQAGTTLVELLVSVMIIGLVLVLLVGALSSGVVQSTLTRRNTAAEATIRYELEKVAAANFDSSPSPYSECFSIDGSATHTEVAYEGACPAGSSLRADVTAAPAEAGMQIWTITVYSWPAQERPVGSQVQTYKADR